MTTSALSASLLQELAAHLEGAERSARAVTKITDAHPALTMHDAYQIQHAIRARKVAAGHRIVGLKAGLTSHAKMQQMGVNEPTYGFLADYFAVPEGNSVKHSDLVHPRVEPEIAFVLKLELRGPDCDVAAVLAATDFVLPALEIIDSRYQNFKFDLISVVADNSSSARFVLGARPLAVDGLDLRALGMVLEINGAPKAIGASGAVLGHPAEAVALIANMLARRGEAIPAGAIVLSGGATEAVSVAPGDFVQLRVQGLGSVQVRFD